MYEKTQMFHSFFRKIKTYFLWRLLHESFECNFKFSNKADESLNFVTIVCHFPHNFLYKLLFCSLVVFLSHFVGENKHLCEHVYSKSAISCILPAEVSC